MNGEPQGSFSLAVMIASFYNMFLNRSSEEMNLGKLWVSPPSNVQVSAVWEQPLHPTAA